MCCSAHVRSIYPAAHFYTCLPERRVAGCSTPCAPLVHARSHSEQRGPCPLAAPVPASARQAAALPPNALELAQTFASWLLKHRLPGVPVQYSCGGGRRVGGHAWELKHVRAGVHYVSRQLGLPSHWVPRYQMSPRCVLLQASACREPTCAIAWSTSCPAQAASAWPRLRRAKAGNLPPLATPVSCWLDAMVAAGRLQHRRANAVSHSACLPVLNMTRERACLQSVGGYQRMTICAFHTLAGAAVDAAAAAPAAPAAPAGAED
jgi:hypothetical protein